MMSRLWKLLRIVVLAFVSIILLAIGALFIFFPRSEPASDEVFSKDPEVVERGRYLVEHVANCLDCHSDRDWNYYSGPIVEATKGRGAPLRVMLPSLVSANITPGALSKWTDGEIARAITAGVSRDGRALHPFMPFDSYAKMEEADVQAVVAYLRSLPAIDYMPPLSDSSFLFRLVGRAFPRPYSPPEPIDRSDGVAYGRYLAKIAECGLCHGADYSGGQSFRVPDSDARSVAANITPAAAHLGSWTRENFIGAFQSFLPPHGNSIPADGENSVMPWSRYSGMRADDLGAIFDYLQTLEPIDSAADGVAQD